MATQIPNKTGFYPYHCGAKPLKYGINDTLDSILFILHKKINEKRLRDLMNDVNSHLERTESFHYGLSEGFINSIDKNAVIEHAVPSHELIMILKAQNPKTRDELMDFMRSHYYICLITPIEDQKLRDHKLSKYMPKNWKVWNERYEKAEIKILINPGK